MPDDYAYQAEVEMWDTIVKNETTVVPGCRWFVGCDRDAVTTVPHPVLGDVPCCQRCADFATS